MNDPGRPLDDREDDVELSHRCTRMVLVVVIKRKVVRPHGRESEQGANDQAK